MGHLLRTALSATALRAALARVVHSARLGHRLPQRRRQPRAGLPVPLMRNGLWTPSYDIASDRAHRHVAQRALDNGQRLQRSLYSLTLTHDGVVGGMALIEGAIDVEHDRALLRPVCRACRKGILYQGRDADTTDREPFWIV